MTKNLLRETWTNVDSFELRLLLEERIGGPSQYDGPVDKLYLPMAREACRVALTFRGNEIVAIESGKAFDPAEWERLCEQYEKEVLVGPLKVGRNYSFSSFKVPGWWRGNRSGVQILPPHDKAPASIEAAEHPLILEFPVKESGLWRITNHRRAREHRNLTLLLNLLLAGGTTLQPRQPEGFWALVPTEAQPLNIQLVQQYFWAELGDVVRPSLSAPVGSLLAEVPPDEYYSKVGNDGGPLRIPEDLDDSICLYQKLSLPNRSKLDRALFWLSTAKRQWSFSASSSYSSLVSAIESLTERGEQHLVYCEKCKRDSQHDAPGATAKFRDFLETYAPGDTIKKRRNQMYELRSGILHGGNLIQLDRDRALGWDPPWWNEREIQWELWGVTRVALRNWLKNPST
jgi:hypothetical protein